MTEAWRELAEIQDRLLELGDEPSEERAVLLERRAVLRAEARSGPTISLDGRSDEDLETEAESLRVRIKELIGQRIDLVQQAGSGLGAGAGADGWGGVQLNQAMDEASGLEGLQQRLRLIEAELDRRS